MDVMISSIWTVAWTIVNVLVLFFLLKKFLFGPVNKIMEKRQSMINSDLENAATAKKDALDMKSEYEANIASAKDEAKEIISNAKKQAKQQSEKSKLQTEAELSTMKKQALKEIELEKQKTLESTHDEIAKLALDAASMIIKKNIDDKDNQKMLDEFLSEGACE